MDDARLDSLIRLADAVQRFCAEQHIRPERIAIDIGEAEFRTVQGIWHSAPSAVREVQVRALSSDGVPQDHGIDVRGIRMRPWSRNKP